ncbi:MAG: GCN5-related N-acetyltransferase [Candidatus Collierbacteria bacterium GW2011_GWB1_45_35]|uniref:GCN5-related N-acetyltransferase n=2 Tax=Candidatus Collieribacteriota TaxID=1752725 RepID=A0A0G1KSY2_9BACT|nr:MAG: GCN5-related N-acetyltransferase [Microgenomates group bacterium GW2011_GWC1_44_23]KKT86605.1 MAG: GCN5-related N-acetyltransferase [Candidatus Collierbacteria bacterium GW2011_GWA2_44_99]KKT96004.1 MAG: GCN5-related N-acetyltransferase [Candidatus Collierbacteria bacterium GW2011_GWA1_45_15]KKU01123.1 MAG: GCN5-related N-acetyltransferase [Candidatus Collierbacteria bacterium GW2011_GWB2_45_17]KKU05735.1 MAG: GCN5-related N-acetyltransferase [Candidatus Collierbacteria bacterium GW2011
MFGVTMVVSHKEQEVVLRAFSKDDLPILVKNFSSMKVHMHTKGMFAQTLENETEWYEKRRVDPSCCLWAIQPKGSDVPIGVSGIHELSNRENSCYSGIIIWDPAWWGKGVASAAHLGRTMFAANFLNRFTIRSTVRVVNEASRKALERVGYTVWGEEPVDDYRGGEWLDTYHLIWFRPNAVSLFYRNGIPEKYRAGVERAAETLEIAKKEVVFP